MRHGVGTRKLGRRSEHRLALFRNLLASLFKAGRIVTTVEKAKEVKPWAERIVTWGKKDGVHARRMVFRYIPDHGIVKKVFDDVAPRFIDRSGGYTRILKLGNRRGDAAESAILEFVDFKFKPKDKTGKKKAQEKTAESKADKKAEAKPKAEKKAPAGQPNAESKAAAPAKKAAKVD
jgi:large subunit ribosomal protein L17